MPTDRQVKWIQENRQRRVTARPVGELAKRYLRGLSFRRPLDHGKIAKVLHDVLGASLASHCAIGEFVGGALAIYVDDASVMYYLRREAQEDLLQALVRQSRKPRIADIRFLLEPGDR